VPSGPDVVRYQGRGRLFEGGRFAGWVQYYLEAWSNTAGNQIILGTIEGATDLLSASGATPLFVLSLEQGWTLACTLQPMPRAGVYEVVAQGDLQPPRS
jgi:hypothetical protein